MRSSQTFDILHSSNKTDLEGAAMNIKHISGNTYCLEDKSINVPFYKLDDRRIILMDSGLDTDPKRGELISLLEPFEVAAIISTHAHPDHLGTNQYYQQRGAKIYMPHFEAGCIENAANLKLRYSLFCITEIEKFFPHILFKADHLLDADCTSVEIEGHEFGIIHAPGHTMDQICVMTPDKVLYLSDALLSEKECKFAKIPYTFAAVLDKATRKKLSGIKAESYVLAHGGIVADISNLIDMNEKCFDNRSDRILRLIDKPMTMEDIIEKVILEFNLRQDVDVYNFRVYERNIRCFVEFLCDSKKIMPRVIGGKLYYLTEK